jgi:hypothetical protein
MATLCLHRIARAPVAAASAGAPSQGRGHRRTPPRRGPGAVNLSQGVATWPRMGAGALGIKKKPAAALLCAALLCLLCTLVLFGPAARQAPLPDPCYNKGSAACSSITADAPMRAYTGLQQVADGSPGQCEQRRFGHEGDGGWYACIEPGSSSEDDVRFLGQQPDSPCLVYSFGIRDDWTFDVAMRDAGCEVHSFDPTIGTPRRCRWGSDLLPHGCQPSGIEFHPIGLGAVDGEKLQVDEDSAKHGGAGELKSLSTIRRELGHQERELTILKFDIEGSEWPILQQIAAGSSDAGGKVAQILTEIHYWGAGCDKAQRVWYERRRKHELDEANVRAVSVWSLVTVTLVCFK